MAFTWQRSCFLHRSNLLLSDTNTRSDFTFQLLSSSIFTHTQTHTHINTHTRARAPLPVLARRREEMLIDRLVTTHSHSRGVGSCSALIHPSIQTPPPSLPPSSSLSSSPSTHSLNLPRSLLISLQQAGKAQTRQTRGVLLRGARSSGGSRGSPVVSVECLPSSLLTCLVCESGRNARLSTGAKKNTHCLHPVSLRGGMLMKRLRSGEDGSSLNQTYIRTSC